MKALSILGSIMIIFMTGLALAAPSKSMSKEEDLKKHVSNWSKEAKDAADFMVKKYGNPTSLTDEMVVWNNVKPFKRSILYKETVDHNFPMPHKDVLEHFIDYKAPEAQKVADIWNFDGSIVMERTKGEMSARCDKEGANILALNLADQIINGQISVDDARMEYGRQITALKDGAPKELTQKLVFSPVTNAGDTDQEIMGKLKGEMKQAEEEKAEGIEE